MNQHVENAFAKLTLSLKIVGMRADGYHLIDAEMVSLDLSDTLTFTEGDGLSIEVESSASRGLPVEASSDNLIIRALTKIERRASVHVVKRIPAGGGLGGGSADAAAVFRWAGKTSDLDVRNAAKLGADVSFCIRGGRARVTGIGERIAPLPFVSQAFTLLTPPFGVSTPAAYRAWDALGGPVSEGPNDLAAGSLAVEPRLAQWRDQLGNLTGCEPILAGSGSTWFVGGEYEGSYNGVPLIVARTVPASLS